MTNNYFKQGNQLLRENNLDEAVAAYKEAIKQNPNIYIYYQNLGEALAKQGKLEEAITNYRCAVELNPDSACSYIFLGEILIQKGDWSEAIKAYEIANKIVPDFSIFQEKLSKSISKLKKENNNNIPKSLAFKTKEISDIKPDSYQSYLDLGDKLRRRGNTDKSIISYLQAINAKPESYVIYRRLTNLLLHNQSEISTNILTKVIQVCQDLIEKAKYTEAHIYLLIARCFTELGEIEKAKEYYQQGSYQETLKSKPNYANYHWQLGRLKGPDFAIIGAPKCGTTTLYEYLNQHPQILPAIFKEISYFDTKLSKQESEYYFAHFPPTPDDKSFITGEADPAYLYDIYSKLNTADHMYNILPSIKLIVLLRNPVDRAISQYYHWQRLGLETSSLESVINSEIENLQNISKVTQEVYTTSKYHYLANSLYFFFLKNWLRNFSRNQILILKTEDFDRNPSIIMNQVFEFLGLDEYSIEWKTRHNVGAYDAISLDERRRLSQFFQPYNRQLEKYLNREFSWD